MAAATRAAGAAPPLEGLLAGLRLALGAGNAREHRTALSGVADWPAVAGLAAHHRVGTLFLQGLRNGCVRLPDPAVERNLAQRHKRDALRGMRRSDAMGRVTAGLAARGIPSLISQEPAAGPALVRFSVRELDRHRPAGSRGCLRRRRPRAARSGLSARDGRHPRDARPHGWYDAVRKDHVYSGSGSNIELHRSLLDNPFLFDPPFDGLDARALTVEIGSARFRTLGDADQLLYLACHGAVHCWQRLKWLCDVAGLLRTMDDASAEQAVAYGRRERLEPVLAPTLRLCREDLRVDLPEPMAALPGDSPRIRFVVGLSRYAWTAPDGLRQLLWKAAMRVGRLFLRGGVRYSLHVRGLSIRRHDLSGVEPPGRLFWFYALARPVLRAVHRLRKAA